MDKQLEFIVVSKKQEVLVAASNLINSTNWTGELWYFFKEEDVVSDDDVITANPKYIQYPLPISACDGCFLNEKKVLIGNDAGWLSIYSIDRREDFDDERTLISDYVFSNDLGRMEHDRSILSVSVSGEKNRNQKAATGSMDGNINIWDIENFSPEKTFDAAHSHYVTCVCFKNSNNCLTQNVNTGSEILASSSLDGYCLSWDRRQQFPAQVLFKTEHTGLTSLEWFSEDNFQMIVGCVNGEVILLDTRHPKEAVLQFQPFNTSISKIKSYKRKSENFIAVSADSRILKVFQLDQNFVTDIYNNESHKDYIRGLSWLPTQDKLLACSWDSKITKHYPFKQLANVEFTGRLTYLRQL